MTTLRVRSYSPIYESASWLSSAASTRIWKNIRSRTLYSGNRQWRSASPHPLKEQTPSQHAALRVYWHNCVRPSFPCATSSSRRSLGFADEPPLRYLPPIAFGASPLTGQNPSYAPRNYLDKCHSYKTVYKIWYWYSLRTTLYIIRGYYLFP